MTINDAKLIVENVYNNPRVDLEYTNDLWECYVISGGFKHTIGCGLTIGDAWKNAAKRIKQDEKTNRN